MTDIVIIPQFTDIQSQKFQKGDTAAYYPKSGKEHSRYDVEVIGVTETKVSIYYRYFDKDHQLKEVYADVCENELKLHPNMN